MGLTVLPALYLASDVGGFAGLGIVRVSGWKAHRPIALAWRRGSSREAALRVIAERLRDHARRKLGADG